MWRSIVAAGTVGVALLAYSANAEAARVRYVYPVAPVPVVTYYAPTPVGTTAIYPGAVPVTTYYAPAAAYGSQGVVAGYAPGVYAAPGYVVSGPVLFPRRTTYYVPAPLYLRGAPVMVYPHR